MAQNKIILRPFSVNDLPKYERWREEINASQYASRFFPYEFNGQSTHSDNFIWSIIIANGEDIGTIWLEKDRTDSSIAVLGIIIGKKDRLGKGIGRQAIKRMIQESRKTLPFRAIRLNVRRNNTRAVSCYLHCGFKVIRENVKTNDKDETIHFYTMEKTMGKKTSPGEDQKEN